MTNTTMNSITFHFEAEAGEEVLRQIFPCWCGETHRGEYGHYAFAQHHCLHDLPLFDSGDEQLMCPDCGKVFVVEKPYDEKTTH